MNQVPGRRRSNVPASVVCRIPGSCSGQIHPRVIVALVVQFVYSKVLEAACDCDLLYIMITSYDMKQEYKSYLSNVSYVMVT